MSKRHNGGTTSDETYADGQPFDVVKYFQYKLLLKPARFTSVDSFRNFGRLVHRATKTVGVGFEADPGARKRPQVREIIFADTPDFRLYRHGFILRRRRSYVDGFASGDPEIVFKYRYPNEHKAAALDVRPQIDGSYFIKFKAQALPLRDDIGGYRTLFSHNCQFPLSHAPAGDRLAVATLARIFPPLAALKKPTEERVHLVNEGIVEELLLPTGYLDFGRGIVAKSNVALWRTRGEHVPLVGEFSFQIKFATREDVPKKPARLAMRFFVSLQREVRDWISLGTTKTGLVYGLNGKNVKRVE